MYIKNLIAIVEFGCEKCHETFIVNSECIKNGFHYECPCGKYHSINRWGKLEAVIRQCDTSWFDKKTEREYLKNYPTGHCAMSSSEYKAMLADIMLNGKRKRIPAKNKHTIRFPDVNEEQLQNTVDALMSLGLKRAEAIQKLDIALEHGLRLESDLVKFILTL